VATVETHSALPTPLPLIERYGPAHLAVFTPEERRRFLQPFGRSVLSRIHQDPAAWRSVAASVAWELLYRIEPDLYGRLIAGEQLHPSILRWLPATIPRAIEVGAGLGRLTLALAPRCAELVAVEPAAPLRARLEGRLAALGYHHVVVGPGFFDSLPLPSGWAEVTLTCSAFTCDPVHGGDPGLAELERVTAGGGLVVIVWPPQDHAWFAERGFELVEFPGDMHIEFPSLEEALEIAAIFYPHAARGIAELGSRRVPYELLGINAPRSLAWRRIGR
jgi:SAM-dependent methyltransferase